MAIPRSDSVSSFSTTGSSQFQDARSRLTDGDSKFADAESRFSDADSKAESKILAGVSNTDPATAESAVVSEVHAEIGNNIGATTEKRVFYDKPDESAPKAEAIKSTQPQQVKEPSTAFVSKEEKIQRLKKENPNPGYQRTEGECHEYIWNCNFLDILDIPNWKTWSNCLCVMCCNSCVNSSTTTVRNTV